MAQHEQTTAAPWRNLTWDDLELWTGTTTLNRGREYHRGGHVQQLSITPDGILLAWVQGTERYATSVALQAENKGIDGPLVSRCSCPVGFRCKHAVAVVLHYLDALKKGKTVSPTTEEDSRWELLPVGQQPDLDTLHTMEDGWVDANPADALVEDEEVFYDGEFDEEDEEADLEDEEEEEEPNPQPPSLRGKGKRSSKSPPSRIGEGAGGEVVPSRSKSSGNDVQKFLDAKPQAWLVNYVLELTQRFPEIGDELKEQIALTSGNMLQLIRDTRREIQKRTREEAYMSHWSGDGHLPNYDGIKKRFETLLAAKQYDALLELGQELFHLAAEQVETSDDEGETAMAVAECMSLVFKAVPKAKMVSEKKLLYVIDLCLADDFSLCDGATEVLDGKWPRAAWSAVADTLQQRLREMPRPDSRNYSTCYQRDLLTRWLFDALENAGREDEVLALCEAEARITGSYERLVTRLLEEGNTAEAEKWAREGIAATAAPYPGIAANLQRILCDLAGKRGDWPTVAAYHAEEFFKHPGIHTYDELLAAATKGGCGDAVKTAMLHFLETGKKPAKGAWPLPTLAKPEPPAPPGPAPTGKGKKAKAARPLPAIPEPPSQPRFDVLMELAFLAKDPDTVLKWFDKLYKDRNILPYSYGFGMAGDNAIRVADFVAAAHPERSIAIYKERITGLIALTQPAAYDAAGQLLRKLRKVLSSLDRGIEWEAFVADLRSKNQRKKRFLEVLDRLKNPKIIDG